MFEEGVEQFTPRLHVAMPLPGPGKWTPRILLILSPPEVGFSCSYCSVVFAVTLSVYVHNTFSCAYLCMQSVRRCVHNVFSCAYLCTQNVRSVYTTHSSRHA